jgi:hypothetical protein
LIQYYAQEAEGAAVKELRPELGKLVAVMADMELLGVALLPQILVVGVAVGQITVLSEAVTEGQA